MWKQVEDVANKEGTFTLYSLGSIPQNQSETLQQLFAKDYPNIKLNYLFVGRSSEEAARVTAEQQSKNYTADVLDSSFRSALVLDHSFLEAFVPPASQDKSVKWVYNPIASSQPPQPGLVERGDVLRDLDQQGSTGPGARTEELHGCRE